jgi:cytochrome c oxidase subunit 4
MAERDPSVEYESAHAGPNYVTVFVALGALTAIEVGLTYMPIPRLLLVGMLLALATAKAALVAMYFMHLRFDSRLLTAVFVIPIVLGSFLIYYLMT